MCVDHAYIDANRVAERYLHHSLAAPEMREFEEHIVDCQECSDRLLLAQMFQTRKKPPTPRLVPVMLSAVLLAIPLCYAISRLL
jgi:hypothetical protein